MPHMPERRTDISCSCLHLSSTHQHIQPLMKSVYMSLLQDLLGAESPDDTTSCHSSISVTSFSPPSAMRHSPQPGSDSQSALPLTAALLLGEAQQGILKSKSEATSSFSFSLAPVAEQASSQPAPDSTKQQSLPAGFALNGALNPHSWQPSSVDPAGASTSSQGQHFSAHAKEQQALPAAPGGALSSSSSVGGGLHQMSRRLQIATSTPLRQASAGQPPVAEALLGQPSSLESLQPGSPSSQLPRSPSSGSAGGKSGKSIWSRMKHGIKRTASGVKSEA
jgi:hypothetical protein